MSDPTYKEELKKYIKEEFASRSKAIPNFEEKLEKFSKKLLIIMEADDFSPKQSKTEENKKQFELVKNFIGQYKNHNDYVEFSKVFNFFSSDKLVLDNNGKIKNTLSSSELSKTFQIDNEELKQVKKTNTTNQTLKNIIKQQSDLKYGINTKEYTLEDYKNFENKFENYKVSARSYNPFKKLTANSIKPTAKEFDDFIQYSFDNFSILYTTNSNIDDKVKFKAILNKIFIDIAPTKNHRILTADAIIKNLTEQKEPLNYQTMQKLFAEHNYSTSDMKKHYKGTIIELEKELLEQQKNKEKSQEYKKAINKDQERQAQLREEYNTKNGLINKDHEKNKENFMGQFSNLQNDPLGVVKREEEVQQTTAPKFPTKPAPAIPEKNKTQPAKVQQTQVNNATINTKQEPQVKPAETKNVAAAQEKPQTAAATQTPPPPPPAPPAPGMNNSKKNSTKVQSTQINKDAKLEPTNNPSKGSLLDQINSFNKGGLKKPQPIEKDSAKPLKNDSMQSALFKGLEEKFESLNNTDDGLSDAEKIEANISTLLNKLKILPKFQDKENIKKGLEALSSKDLDDMFDDELEEIEKQVKNYQEKVAVQEKVLEQAKDPNLSKISSQAEGHTGPSSSPVNKDNNQHRGK